MKQWTGAKTIHTKIKKYTFHLKQRNTYFVHFMKAEKANSNWIKQNFMLKVFIVGYQIYLIPTIKFTYSKTLNGNRGLEFIWLKWGIEITIN